MIIFSILFSVILTIVGFILLAVALPALVTLALVGGLISLPIIAVVWIIRKIL